MSRSIPVSIETDERTFDHGQVVVEKANQWESNIDVDVQLVVGSGDVDAFHSELQDLVKKYAI